jgi:ditrans,polycis-polyprenyl diphosphate synthase
MDMAKVKLSQLAQHGDLLDRYGASIRILGQRELVKPDVIEAIDRAVEMTSRNGDAILNVCFPYTSRDEITTAIRDTVIEYSKPLEPAPNIARPFSESHIAHNIRVRHLTSNPTKNGHLETPRSSSPTTSTSSTTSDTDPDTHPDPEISSLSSSTTLHPSPSLIPSPTATSPPTSSPQLHSSKPTSSPTYPSPELITPNTLTNHMFTAGTPPLDLLIRTSGVERLSDFMLWQCHQDTEIVFLDVLWPEFDLWSFLPVIWEWQWRRRVREKEEDGGRKRRTRGRSVSKKRDGGRRRSVEVS